MPNGNHFLFRPLIVFIVVLMNMITTIPAHAEDEAPPVESTSEVDPVQPTDQDPVEEETPLLSTPGADPAIDVLLSALPEGTDIVVLDESGEVAPLATAAAADAIASSDPIWCPAGVAKPVPGVGGCTQSFGQFVTGNPATGLLDYLMANQPGMDGVIWIEKAYNGQDNTAIVFNGATTLAVMADFKLTFNGGWNGSGTGTMDLLFPSTFDVPLSITGWKNTVTINNILVTGTTAGVTALNVQTTGAIVVKNVKSAVNTGNGAFLDNSAGLGAVTVTDSQFNNNTNYGLRVKSKGAITLSNIIANNNTNNGISLENNIAASISSITLTGTNIFSNNSSSGAYIASNGAITLNNIYANSNALYGLYLYNANAGTPAIKITGTNQAKYNGTGLYITSRGQVTINNFTADFNNGGGGYIANLTGPVTSGITFTGTNSFGNNATYGLSLNSFGTILLNNMAVNNNGTGNVSGDGLVIHNESGTPLKNVTLTGTNSFNGNYGYGLSIFSSGIVSLSNITASGNLHSFGVSIDNTFSGAGVPKAVTLLGTNNFNSNYGTGIIIDTYGAITTNNITADGNGTGANLSSGYGADFDNSLSTLPQHVKLGGTNSFSSNYSTGLLVQSKGIITVNSVTANDSTMGRGVDLTNMNGVSSSITLSGINKFSGNTDTNIIIQTKGAVTLSNVTSTSSGNNGANINNTGAPTALAVTLLGTNSFSNNFGSGLFISSRGAIMINALDASNNTNGYGAMLDNTSSTNNSVITLKGVNIFNGNGLGGLYVFSKGTVTASSLTANSNLVGYGVSIDSDGSGSAGNVNLTGPNFFDGNSDTNLFISTVGIITLSNITSVNSTFGSGAFISNLASGTVAKAVTLTGNHVFSGNDGSGITIVSNGAVTTSNLTANGNNTRGIDIDNSSAPTPLAVTLNGTNIFNQNTSDGLKVISKGLITVNNLTGNTNGGYAVDLFNQAGGSAFGVVMKGYASFSGNAHGLQVLTSGAITGANLNISNSTTGKGAILDNSTSTAFSTVKLTGTNTFNGNNMNGLSVTSAGAVTLNSITANGSLTDGGVGINNQNSGTLKPQPVTFTGLTSINNNATTGIAIETYGAIVMNGVMAGNNGVVSGGGYGLYIENSAGITAQNVTLNGLNVFNGNKGKGLFLTSKGNVTINALTASSTVSDSGASITNTNGSGTVKLTGSNTFNNNNGIGLQIQSNGAVSLNNLTANSNGLSGVAINNSSASGPSATVSITGVNTFNQNTNTGLGITSQAAVLLSNITANENGSSGLNIDNSFGPGNVTLSGVNNFVQNMQNGAYVISNGNINMSKVSGDDNAQSGLFAITSGNITLTCGSFVANTQYGLNVTNAPTTTLIGVVVVANTAGNTNITGGGTIVTAPNCPLP